MEPNPSKIKLGEQEEEQDRISSLPDPIIRHILSFLPSTITAVRTCVLSKQWRYQWTHVPVLIFGYDIPHSNFSTFVDNALLLHDFPTIAKFVIRKPFLCPPHPTLPVWIRYTMRKQVKELTLDFGYDNKHPTPRFLFNNGSLMKFEAQGLDFKSCGLVNWPSLKVLSLTTCDGFVEAIGNFLVGCPSLESLQFWCRHWNVPVVIASRSLKKLVVGNSNEFGPGAALEISCPNLEELEISYTFFFGSYRLVDLPSSARVTLDLNEVHAEFPKEDLDEFDENRVQPILESVKHVDQLNIWSYFLEVFSIWVVVRNLPCPSMKTKCLALNVSNFNTSLPGIVCLLRSSPGLEKLNIKFEYFLPPATETIQVLLESHDFGENVHNNLGPHLKSIEIIGLDECHLEVQYDFFLRFLKFLVRNSRSLEKLAIYRQEMTQMKDCHCRSRDEFALQHLNILLSIQRCAPNALVSFHCCKANAIASQR